MARNIDNHTSITYGLSAKEVNQRIEAGFSNQQSNQETKSYQDIFRDNIFTLFNLINAILAGLIIFIGSFKNLLFLGVVVSNLVIGIVQELRAKKVLDRLRLITQPYVQVLRDGNIVELTTQELVLDDIMLLASGSQICADAFVCEGRLEVNESLVTGESDIIIKQIGDTLYSGSFVVSGNAKVQVYHVGDDNYAQTIVKDAKVFRKHKSQLRDSINFIIKTIGIIIIPMGILLFSKQMFLTQSGLEDSIVSTVAALIGMIPEGLVLLTSIALAVGSINLARRKTLVQELYCIETLARVDVLCLDKTGTITEGNMRVENMILYDERWDMPDILSNMMKVLTDDNATALAIRQFAKQPKTNKIAVHSIPFSSARKLSAVSFQEEGTYTLGAYEFVCNQEDPTIRKQIDEQTKLGNRVLVLAHSDDDILEETLPHKQKVLGLLILSDPIRKEAPQTLDYFLAQGVDVKIISGDDPKTVHAIARKAHLKSYDRYIDMSTVEDSQISEVVEQYTVFGRVSPQQKKMMLHALKENGHITAMIGDGVNDVMALKEADCSISVAQGSEAAKNIANLVLLNNNFANMPHIVKEGRRVINNIQRSASLFLVKTTFSTLLSFLTLFFMRNYPFEPIQLTLISTLTIGIPSFFLALEANYARVEGNFLINVFSKALPGALCVVLSILYVNMLSLVLPLSKDVISTMCVIMTAATLIVVLYRVCTPFSKKRFLLFSIMTSAFLLAILCIPSFFNLVRLPLYAFILTLIGIFAIPFVMNALRQIGHFFYLKERILRIAKS